MIGRKESPSRSGNRHNIVDKSPEKILPNFAEGGTAQAQSGGHIAQGIPHQQDISGFRGDFGARLEGDAHIGLGQGRGIVDPVADHADDLSLAMVVLEMGDRRCFVRWFNLGKYLLGWNAQRGGDAVGGFRPIAREHHHPNALGLQLLDHFPGFGAGLVVDGDESKELVVGT